MAAVWVDQMQELVGELPSLAISFPCVGANAGLVALYDSGHRGIIPVHMYDIDEACRKPLAALLGVDRVPPTLGAEHGDILKVDPNSLTCPDGLVSGPPCQFVATGGKQDPWNHPGLMVFNQVIAWIENFAARELKFFVLENVKGLSRRYGGQPSVLSLAEARLRSMTPAFGIRVWSMNSKDYTLAQHRERWYIIGVRASVLRQAGHRAIPPRGPPPMPRCGLSWFLTGGIPNTSLSSLTHQQCQNLLAYKMLASCQLHAKVMQGMLMACDVSRRPTASWGPKYRIDDVVDTLTTFSSRIFVMSLGEGQSPTVHRFLQSDEMCRLQGFRPELFAACTEKETTRLVGNSFSVPVVGVVLRYCMQVLTAATETTEERSRSRSRSRSLPFTVRSSPSSPVCISDSD